MPQTVTSTVLDIDDQNHVEGITKTLTSNFTIQGGVTFLCDASGGNFTVTLPLAGQNENRVIIIILISPTGQVTVEGSGSETINQSLSKIIQFQWSAMEVRSDGLNWVIT